MTQQAACASCHASRTKCIRLREGMSCKRCNRKGISCIARVGKRFRYKKTKDVQTEIKRLGEAFSALFDECCDLDLIEKSCEIVITSTSEIVIKTMMNCSVQRGRALGSFKDLHTAASLALKSGLHTLLMEDDVTTIPDEQVDEISGDLLEEWYTNQNDCYKAFTLAIRGKEITRFSPNYELLFDQEKDLDNEACRQHFHHWKKWIADPHVASTIFNRFAEAILKKHDLKKQGRFKRQVIHWSFDSRTDFPKGILISDRYHQRYMCHLKETGFAYVLGDIVGGFIELIDLRPLDEPFYRELNLDFVEPTPIEGIIPNQDTADLQSNDTEEQSEFDNLIYNMLVKDSSEL